MGKEKKISSEKNVSNAKESINEEHSIDSYERKILRLKNLIEVSKIINSSLEKEALLQSILFSCQGQFFITNASIFLSDVIDDANFTMESFIGLDSEPKSMKFSDKDPLISLLKTEVLYLDIEKQLSKTKYKKFHKHNKLLKGELIFPLKVKQKLDGFLVIGEKLDGSEFNKEELDHMLMFMELAGIAVENMTLFELVTLDRMTKLHNHHYFHSRLYEEISRAKRYNHNLTLMLIDIDKFKHVNDTYGHQEGDVVIKWLAGLLREKVRSTDIVARYGGEEFGIILPESTLQQGNFVAEKIRKSMEKRTFITNDKIKFNVTISMGISSYIEDMAEAEFELINLADRALYQSKKNGRNRITLYTELEN